VDLTRRGTTEVAAMAIAVASALWACDWVNLDAIAPLAIQGVGASEVGASDVGATTLGATDGAPTEDGDLEATDASDGSADAAFGPSTPCTSTNPAVEQWTFDTGIEGWILLTDPGVASTLAWTGSTGHPTAGAVQVEVSPTDAAALSGAWLVLEETSPADLAGRILSAWVWLDGGPSPHLKVFVQTGTDYSWADGGTVFLTPHTWTCVSLDVSMPAYNQADYDPTQVIRLGFELLGTAPFGLYVDTVQYD
jgi:hypothetical protein